MLLLQTVNLSLNPERHLNFISGKATYLEDLRINKLESISEFVLEYMLGFDVPETQDADDDTAGKIFVMHVQPATAFALALTFFHAPTYFGYNKQLPEQLKSLESPPPKRICLLNVPAAIAG